MEKENKPLFYIGDPVDLNTRLYSWSFCGVIQRCEPHSWGTFVYWVQFVDRYNSKISPEKHGTWYREDQLRHALNPPVD